MKFTPMNGQVLIKKYDFTEKVTTGGLVIPQGAGGQFFVEKAEVVKVGPVADTITGRMYQVREGDIVFVRNWSGNDITIDGIDCKLINETEILGYWRE